MKYSSAEKSEAIKRYQHGEPIHEISQATGISKSTLYSWIKPYSQIVSCDHMSVTLKDYDDLKRHAEKLECMIKVLKCASCTATAPLSEKLAALEAMYGQYSVRVLCEALEVPRGTFYNHILRNKKGNSSYAQHRRELCAKILSIHEDTGHVLGARKIRAILMEQGECVSLKLVNELMKEMNLSSARKSAKCDVPALCSPKKKANLLHRSFHADAPNKIWVSDVTCIKLKNRYYYICVIIDLFSRKVVSYRISLSNSTQLVTSTFKSAYQKRVPCGELTFHSDQGTPYTSYAFQRLLHQRHVKQSFSNPGSPLDNAVAESFFSTMKKEELYRIDYQSEAQFRQRVEAYVSFFNHVRPHMSLNYKTPDQVEAHFRASTISGNATLPGSDPDDF